MEVYALTDVNAAATAPPREAETFRDLYAVQFAPMVRLAYVTTGSLPAAEDLVQDAFAEVYRRFDRLEAPVAYLRRVVVSRCISWHRRRGLEQRRAHAAATWLQDEPPLGPDATAVRTALRGLRPRQRSAVFLRYYLGLSEVDIAAALECRPGTVKSMLSRALGTLREQLGDDDER
jgi:RNA polymerase sigma-70 factor (sigma-E family)